MTGAAELWGKGRVTDPGILYHTAQYRAVTAAIIRETNGSPEGVKTANDESDRAMSLLRQAVAGGFRGAARIKRNKDLDALRDREDFRKHMSALESARE